jgi:hypothetical protein
MPAGLTSALGFGDFLGSGVDAVKDASGAVAGDAGRAVAGAAGKAAMNTAGDAVDAGGSLLKFLVPLLLLGALAFLGYTIITGGSAGDGETSAATDLDVDSENLESLIPNGVDFGEFDIKGLQEKFTGITDGLNNVSTDSAEGLVGKITELTGSIDSMGIDKLTGPAKSAAGGVIGSFIETVQSSLDSMTDDGLLSMLKPVVNALVEKLDTFK